MDQSRNCIEKPIIHLKIIGGACIFRYTLAFLKIKPVCRLSNKIRLSDTLLANMKIERGKTRFAIYLHKKENQLILKIVEDDKGNSVL